MVVYAQKSDAKPVMLIWDMFLTMVPLQLGFDTASTVLPCLSIQMTNEFFLEVEKIPINPLVLLITRGKTWTSPTKPNDVEPLASSPIQMRVKPHSRKSCCCIRVPFTWLDQSSREKPKTMLYPTGWKWKNSGYFSHIFSTCSLNT